MGTLNQTPYFFKDKPLFGLDIGRSSLKVVQVEAGHKTHRSQKHGPHPKSAAKDDIPKPRLLGYGSVDFDPSAIEDGVIVKPEVIAKAAQDLFKSGLLGKISAKRVALTIPAYRSFTRSIQLPNLKPHELTDAVKLEAEEYIPVPLEQLYLDYTPISKTKDGLEVLAIAVPQNIVDSYIELSAIMGLEPVLIETTMSAAGRLFGHDYQSDVPSVIIDFGSLSSDISIYDHGVVTSGTVEGGGQVFNELIEEHLKVSPAEAQVIKTKYGMGRSKRQQEIQTALEPTLQKINKEIKRLVRYHAEHYGTDKPIGQVVALGGGANIPGLSDYLTNNLRLAVRVCDPWEYIDYRGLQPPAAADRTMFATAIGLALTPAAEVLQ